MGMAWVMLGILDDVGKFWFNVGRALEKAGWSGV